MTAKRNICIAKQTLVLCDKKGKAIKSQNYDDFWNAGGSVHGNVRALNPYEFKISNDKTFSENTEYMVQDDVYLEYSDLAMMSMSMECFYKYFVIVEGDGKEDEEE